MRDDIVVTARLRSDGTGSVNVKIGATDNVAGLLGSLIETLRKAQENNSYKSYESEYNYR